MADHSTQTDLFSPYTMGALQLANRIVMAPVTRSRYSEEGIPHDLHPLYYAQRAGAGLRRGAELTIAPRESYYGGGAKGYTDWPNRTY